jgi:hypothetical protein
LKYIGPAVNAGKIAAGAVLNVLTKAPYNFAFGLYLVNDYQRRISDFKDCPGFEKVVKDCLQFDCSICIVFADSNKRRRCLGSLVMCQGILGFRQCCEEKNHSWLVLKKKFSSYFRLC